jgi:hypothetical protein
MLKTRGLRTDALAGDWLFFANAFGIGRFGAKSASAASRALVACWRSSPPAGT